MHLKKKTDYSTYEYAESFIIYFERNIENNQLFLPELETAKSVLRIMKQPNHTAGDFLKIKEAMALIEKQKHYDGTGWYGFKNAVTWWLESNEL
jgi:hypothetical protein